jgi:chitinase
MSDLIDQGELLTAEKAARRLSFPRLVLAVAIAGVLVAGGIVGQQRWTLPLRAGSGQTWFAGYVDVTSNPTVVFETPTANSRRDVVLSFIVSASAGPCAPTWDPALTLAQASAGLDLDRKIATLEQRGGGLAVSFGGALNDELATTCHDVHKLAAAYTEVMDRYHSSTIDLDLEAANLSDRAAGHRRAQAIKTLQLDRRASGKSLAVWLTLPVSPSGLTQDGQAAIGEMLSTGVDLSGVNALAMDFSSSGTDSQSMLVTTTNALNAVQRQLGNLYSRAGTKLSSAAVWSKLGVTPMIGQNDVPGEVFSLNSAKGLNEFVLSHGVGRVSMWSLNRDKTCGPNYVGVKRASAVCSGVSQGNQKFADLLASGSTGRLSLAAGK